MCGSYGEECVKNAGEQQEIISVLLDVEDQHEENRGHCTAGGKGLEMHIFFACVNNSKTMCKIPSASLQRFNVVWQENAGAMSQRQFENNVMHSRLGMHAPREAIRTPSTATQLSTIVRKEDAGEGAESISNMSTSK